MCKNDKKIEERERVMGKIEIGAFLSSLASHFSRSKETQVQ